ncbi:MAG TPA: RcnB family protein [Oxalicibacterium sp.]|nr:RcnB family protein [Oxalicibacterium sp.]
MKNRIIISALIAAALAAQGGAAFADDHGHGHHDDHRGPPHKVHHDNRYHDRHDHHEGRGAGPHHDFYRGGHLSREYRHRQYVVENWRVHHLNAPPRGYHWVQTGPDYVLVAISSGIIAQIVLSN